MPTKTNIIEKEKDIRFKAAEYGTCDLKPDHITLSFGDEAAKLALYTYIKFALIKFLIFFLLNFIDK